MTFGTLSTFNLETEDLKNKWLAGKCLDLDAEACELCYMHQYGLHKTNHDVPKICSGEKTVSGNFLMKSCYWDAFPPLPKEMKSVPMAQPLIDQKANSEPFCDPNATIQATTTVKPTGQTEQNTIHSSFISSTSELGNGGHPSPFSVPQHHFLLFP